MPARPLRMLSLCSGIGGIDYAWSHVLGQEIAGQVEIDDYCNAVLELQFPDVPRRRDIREVRGDEFGHVDIAAGGIPCQPWSVAGQQRGTRDDRHLWPAMRRIIQTVRPTWVLIENVAGFAALALDDVCTDLEFLFYEVTAFMVPAAAVEAPHLRERVFVVAHAYEQRRQQEPRSASRHEASASWRPIQERATLRHHVATGNGQGAIGVGLADTDDQRLTRPQLLNRDARTRRQSVRKAAGQLPDADSAASHVVADTTHGGLRRGQSSGRTGQPAQRHQAVAHAQHGRREGRQQARQSHSIASTIDFPGGTSIRRQAQSRMGGATDGLSRWLDRHRWPAGPTEAQYAWEAPRTITGSVANRAHRLKALGNAVVPAQVAPILAAIIEAHWQYAEAL